MQQENKNVTKYWCLCGNVVYPFSPLCFNSTSWFSFRQIFRVLISVPPRVRSRLEMETEVVDSDGGGGAPGDWTQSHVKSQRLASRRGVRSAHKSLRRGFVGAGGTGRRIGATLGTRADSADASHPLRVRLSLAPRGPYSLMLSRSSFASQKQPKHSDLRAAVTSGLLSTDTSQVS